LEFHASSEICNGNEYTVTDADGKFLYCQPCDTCHEGYGLEPTCGSTVQRPVENVSCEQCPTGTFSNKYDSGPCYKCQVCDEHQVVISYCNSQADTNCSQTCNSGYYFARGVSQSCHKCSYCCDDEKDEEQVDCARQGLKKSNQHCSHRVDKNCAPDLSTDISSLSTDGKKQFDLGKTLAIFFGTLAGVAIIVLVVYVLWKRRQSHGQGQITAPVAQDLEIPSIVIGDATVSTCALEEYRNVSQDAALTSPTTGSTLKSSPVSRHINPGFASSSPGTPQVSPHGTPQSQKSHDSHTSRADENGNVSQDAALPSPATGSTLKPSPVSRHINPGFASSSPGTPRVSPHGTPKSQKSHDSHTSRAEEYRNVSQDAALTSPTTGSTLKPSPVSRHINPGFASSSPGTPQVSPHGTPKSQKGHNSHTSGGQIEIVQQPKSQNQREGSRVEFTCECQVQGSCEVWYHWLKDDTELQEQNNSSLILDSVKMRDFGCYSCRITHGRGHREAVTSEPAFLEVSPCEGKRLKYLREVDLDTRDKIAILLEDKTPGLGGCRQIAAKYGMEEHLVRGLANLRQSGNAVLEFLRGSKPDLTVYSFCKTLKEDNMNRCDIVMVLEDHLSIEKESK